MNETIFLGDCPVIRPEGIYYDGRRVIALSPGLHGVGVGDIGDLFAYRRQWEPFIKAHLELWRHLNELFEGVPTAKECPAGIFKSEQINPTLSEPTRQFCARLALTRMLISDTHIGSIQARWNAWKDKSSADMLAGAAAMLEWQQGVVMSVGGPDKDRMVQLAKDWKLDIRLPDAPSFSTQQEIIARIEGAYATTKGVLQILGYGAGETITGAGDLTQAVAQGLTDTAKALPKAMNWALIAGAIAVAVVGGALVVYYVPRRQAPAALRRITPRGRPGIRRLPSRSISPSY